MYDWLERRLPPHAAAILLGVWYAILVVLVLYSAFEPQATFRYIML